ncbi:hypothetical protein Emag_002723 [Eimeria magna]
MKAAAAAAAAVAAAAAAVSLLRRSSQDINVNQQLKYHKTENIVNQQPRSTRMRLSTALLLLFLLLLLLQQVLPLAVLVFEEGAEHTGGIEPLVASPAHTQAIKAASATAAAAAAATAAAAAAPAIAAAAAAADMATASSAASRFPSGGGCSGSSSAYTRGENRSAAAEAATAATIAGEAAAAAAAGGREAQQASLLGSASDAYFSGDAAAAAAPTAAAAEAAEATEAAAGAAAGAAAAATNQRAATRGVAEVDVLAVHNVMAYAQLDCPVDLPAAARGLGNSVFCPREFHSVRVDVRCGASGVASLNIFANGKMMGTGANSVLGLRVAMLKVARRLRALGIVGPSTKLKSFRVGNLLASYALPFPLQLQQLAALAAAHNTQLDVDPERFPGARIKVPIGSSKDIQEGPAAGSGGDLGAWTRSSSGQAGVGGGPERKAEVVTLHAFSSGRITITGARSAASLQQALVSVLPLLLRCPGQQVQPALR